MLTTGDEATELAYAAARAPGTEIGVNLRVAAYSPVSGDTVAMVGRILREFARQQGVRCCQFPLHFTIVPTTAKQFSRCCQNQIKHPMGLIPWTVLPC